MNNQLSKTFITDDYEIYFNNRIGKGAFSKVYLGKYKNMDTAIKIINTSKLEQRVINQLNRELQIIEILMKYPHQNIIGFHKIEKRNGLTIIIMELCDGSELKKFIGNEYKGLSEEQILNISKQLITGYLHLLKFSIVHRDIKPTNILITKDGVLKIIDFGLSKVISSDLTQTICGSPLYMAPEILYKQDYDSSADIWSIGILIYELLYGFTPFYKSRDLNGLKNNISKKEIIFPEINKKKDISGIPT